MWSLSVEIFISDFVCVYLLCARHYTRFWGEPGMCVKEGSLRGGRSVEQGRVLQLGCELKPCPTGKGDSLSVSKQMSDCLTFSEATFLNY